MSALSKRLSIGPYAARVVVFSALILVVALILVILAASRDTYEVKAFFNDVRGLIPGGDVTAGAQVVGSVASVELVPAREEVDEEGRVLSVSEVSEAESTELRPLVTLAIDPDFRLHEGAFADIRLASNVGAVNRAVDLSQGDISKPELEDGKTILSGREFTDNPVDFDLAVSTLKPKVRVQIKKVLIGFDEAFKGRGEDFNRTLRHSGKALSETASLLEQVNRDGEAVSTIVSEGQRVVSALASSPSDLGEAAERTATLLDATAARQGELRESVTLLGPALAEGRKLLERTAEAAPNASELVRGLRPLVAELGPLAKLIPPATEAAGPFFEQTRKLVSEAPEQLRTQLPLMRLGSKTLPRLIPLLERLNPVADELRVFTPETIGFFQNTADAAAPYDANGHGIRTAFTDARVPPGSAFGAGTIGAGACGPGLIEVPYSRLPGANECDPWADFESSHIGGGE